MRQFCERRSSFLNISIPSCSHEKKKEYWDQLESRCRFLHRRLASGGGHSGGGGVSSHYLHPNPLALPVSLSAANLLQSASAPSSHCECCAAASVAAAAGMTSDGTFEEK